MTSVLLSLRSHAPPPPSSSHPSSSALAIYREDAAASAGEGRGGRGDRGVPRAARGALPEDGRRGARAPLQPTPHQISQMPPPPTSTQASVGAQCLSPPSFMIYKLELPCRLNKWAKGRGSHEVVITAMYSISSTGRPATLARHSRFRGGQDRTRRRQSFRGRGQCQFSHRCPPEFGTIACRPTSCDSHCHPPTRPLRPTSPRVLVCACSKAATPA